MKTAITLFLFIVFFLFVGHFQITFKPFAVSMPYWYRAVGIFLLALAIFVYNVGEYAGGYEKGLKDGVDMTIKVLKEKVEEFEHEQRNN